MPHQLVTLLREVSTELATLGNHAADQASSARATALSITLEAVKAGVPPGTLRELAVQLREDAAHAAERLAHDRARISVRIGQALARATTLAREADVLAPTRQRAAWLAAILHGTAREVSLAGEAAGEGGWITSVRLTDAVDRARVIGGPRGIVLHVRGPRGRGLEAELDWCGLEAAWLSGDPGVLARTLAGERRAPEALPSGLIPRVWLMAGEQTVSASHREACPEAGLPEEHDATVVELGRRRVAIARVPPVLAGLEAWRVVAAAAPRLRTTPPQQRRAGEVILFPGMR